ncbi:BEN domain-containing protein 5-like [Ornithodoros turicata]|uniref:BEN domain-containing protein 5-like n=1 Tax=Ornithodoros turicata TaxID=34597 RepID=UPI003139F779
MHVSTDIPTAYHAELTTLPLLSEVNGRVHLGNGIFVTEEQWQWLLGRRRDSLFCKEAVKILWPISELKGRSITGTPCRRFANKENGVKPRKALTPVKLQAVTSAFEIYVEETPSEVPQKDRLNKMNRFIAELLNDFNK